MLPIHRPEDQHLDNEHGFTLLEIIAVLVILSILAVVALPRYFNLQNQAAANAMQTAMAEAIGRVNGYFAQQLLSGSIPANISYTDGNLGTNLGDFHMAVVGGDAATGGSTFTITVTGDATPVQGLTLTTTLRRPGLP